MSSTGQPTSTAADIDVHKTPPLESSSSGFGIECAIPILNPHVLNRQQKLNTNKIKYKLNSLQTFINIMVKN